MPFGYQRGNSQGCRNHLIRIMKLEITIFRVLLIFAFLKQRLNADGRRCNADLRRFPDDNLRESALDLRLSALNISFVMQKSIGGYRFDRK